MRQLFSIALLQFRLFMKNKGTVAMMFALPLVFTALFGVLMTGSSNGSGPKKTPVAVVDRDGTFASRQVVASLEKDAGVSVIIATDAQLDRLFVDRKIDAGTIIPAGFGKAIAAGGAPELSVVSAPGGNMQVAVQPAISRAATVVAENYVLAQRLNKANPEEAYARVAAERQVVKIGLTETKEAGHPNQNGSQLQGSALGMTVMFVMFSLVSMTGAILQERSTGTWGRLLMAPGTRFSLMGGYLLAFFLTGCLQMAVLVTASSLMFGIDWGPLPQLATVSAVMVLCSAGLGLFIAALVRSAEQQRAIGSAVVLITCFLGGVYWPLDLMSKTMQTIGRLTPQAWAMDGLREVMLRGGSWANLVTPLAALGGLAVLFMGIGLMRVRYE